VDAVVKGRINPDRLVAMLFVLLSFAVAIWWIAWLIWAVG